MTVTAWKRKLLIEHGEFAQGVALVRQAVDTGEQPGWRMCHAEFLGYLAEGLAGLGQLDKAAGEISECDIVIRINSWARTPDVAYKERVGSAH
jgi:hypothetical protein